MNKNNFAPKSYKFHSVTNVYRSMNEADLNLEIYEYGSDAVEIKLINTNYKKHQNALNMQIISFVISLYIYAILLFLTTIHLVYIDIFFILWSSLILWRLSHLVESEKLILCYDFGIHLQMQKYLGKRNRFVAASNIYDIVINEVLEDLGFRYILILRTNGVLFKKKPIICIFEAIKPSYECINMIYKHLNKVIIKTKSV